MTRSTSVPASRRIALALILLLGLSACGQRNVEWTAITPSDGSFEVEIPGKPRHTASSLATPVGPAPVEMWVHQDADRVYMVGYTEYPAKARAAVEEQELLESARDGAVARTRGKLLLDEPHTVGDVTGRRIEVDAEGGRVRVRGDLFVVGRRLYQVFATTEPPEIGSAEVARFLDSFVLLPHVSTQDDSREQAPPGR